MHKRLRQCVRLLMASLLVLVILGVAGDEDKKTSLQDALKKSYLDLFEFAQQPLYRKAEIDNMREGLKRGQEMCVSGFKDK